MFTTVMKGLRFADNQESYFEYWKRSYMGCAALLCGLFAEAQELSIQAANSSKMGSAVLKFADGQKSLIQVAKRSNVGSTVMKGLQFADTQESRFQASKLSNMNSVVLVCGRSADIEEFSFQPCKTFRYGL